MAPRAPSTLDPETYSARSGGKVPPATLMAPGSDRLGVAVTRRRFDICSPAPISMLSPGRGAPPRSIRIRDDPEELGLNVMICTLPFGAPSTLKLSFGATSTRLKVGLLNSPGLSSTL